MECLRFRECKSSGFLERALEWVSKDNVSEYMSRHRFDNNITELKDYFNSVIDWVSTVFTDVESEMKGLEWGRLYETYRKKPYNSKTVSDEVKKLYGDPYVKIAEEFLNIYLEVQQTQNF